MRPSPAHKGFRSDADKLAAKNLVKIKNDDAKAPNRVRLTGSRQVFSIDFVRAFHQDFLLHGPDVIEVVRRDDPAAYLNTAVKLVPQHIQISTNPFDGLEGDGLRQQVRAILDGLAGVGALPEVGGNGVCIEGSATQSVEPVQAVSETDGVS